MSQQPLSVSLYYGQAVRSWASHLSSLCLHLVICEMGRSFNPTIIVVQWLSRVQLFATPWSAAHQTSPSFTISWSLLKPMSVESVMPSNHLILCRPLLLLPPIFPNIRVFSSESVFHIRWPKYWSFSFSTSSSNGYSAFISFRMDWFDLPVQGTLMSLLQHYNSKASILQHSAFFMVQPSHPYMTTGKTIALTIWNFYYPHFIDEKTEAQRNDLPKDTELMSDSRTPSHWLMRDAQRLMGWHWGRMGYGEAGRRAWG